MNEDSCYKEVLVVKCIFNNTDCPEDDILPCSNLQLVSKIHGGDYSNLTDIFDDSNSCNKILIRWSTYLIYKKYFKEVKTNGSYHSELFI